MEYRNSNKDGMLVLFGNFLRFYRLQIAKISIEEVSEIMQLNKSYLSLIENGTNSLHIRHFLKLSKYLECDFMTLSFFMSFLTLNKKDRDDIIEIGVLKEIKNIELFNIKINNKKEYQKTKKDIDKKILLEIQNFLKKSISLHNRKDILFALDFVENTKRQLSKN